MLNVIRPYSVKHGESRSSLSTTMKDLLREIAEFLTFCGFLVHAHSSPYEAIAFMEVHEFDVLLSDVEMPGMRGTQLATWLSDGRPKIQVILVSGLEIHPRELRNRWSFFRKPLDFAVIQQAIESSE